MDFFSLELKASMYTTKQPIAAMIYQKVVREDYRVSGESSPIIAFSPGTYQPCANSLANNRNCALRTLASDILKRFARILFHTLFLLTYTQTLFTYGVNYTEL
jgi:hypothetical protein